MPVNYIDAGVKYDVDGLLSTARYMEKREELKRNLIMRFYNLGQGNLGEHEEWMVSHLDRLYKMADKAEQAEILRKVLAI